MKVYILLGYTSEDGAEVLGVFSNRGQAEGDESGYEANPMLFDTYPCGFEIQEHDVL